MGQKVERSYSRAELQQIVNSRRRELTVEILGLRQRMRALSVELEAREGELDELEKADRLLE